MAESVTIQGSSENQFEIKQAAEVVSESPETPSDSRTVSSTSVESSRNTSDDNNTKHVDHCGESPKPGAGCEDDAHLIANLDATVNSPPDLNILAHFAADDDNLSNPDEISGNIYDNYFDSSYSFSTNNSANTMSIISHKDGQEEPTTSGVASTNSSDETPYRTMFPILERQLKAPRCRSPTSSERQNISTNVKQNSGPDDANCPSTSQSVKFSSQGCVGQAFQPSIESSVITSSVDCQSTYNYFNNDKLPSYFQACASKAATQQYSSTGSNQPSSILSALQNSHYKGPTQHHVSTAVDVFTTADRQPGGWSSGTSSLRPYHSGNVPTTDSYINTESGTTSLDLFTSQSTRIFCLPDRRSITANFASDHHNVSPNKENYCWGGTYSLIEAQDSRSHDLTATMTYPSPSTPNYAAYMVCQMPPQYNDTRAENSLLLPSTSACPSVSYSNQDSYCRLVATDFQGPGLNPCLASNDATLSLRLLPPAPQCLPTPISTSEITRTNESYLGQTMTTLPTRPANHKPVGYENNYYNPHIPHSDISVGHQVMNPTSRLPEDDALPGNRLTMMPLSQDSMRTLDTGHYPGDPIRNSDIVTPVDMKPSSSNLYCTLCCSDGHPCTSDSGATTLALSSPMQVKNSGPNTGTQHAQSEMALRRRPRYMTVKDMLMERARQRYYEQCLPLVPPSVPASSCSVLLDHQDSLSAPVYTNSGNMCPPTVPSVRPMMMAAAKPYNAITQSVSVHLSNNGTMPSCIPHPTVVEAVNLPTGRVQPPGIASAAPLVMVHNPRMPMMPAFVRRGRTILKGQGQEVNSCPQQPMSILQAKLMEVNSPVTPISTGEVKPSNHPFFTILPSFPNNSIIQEKLRQSAPIPTSGRVVETGPELQKKNMEASSSYIALPSAYKLQMPQLFLSSSSNSDAEHCDGRPPRHYDIDSLQIGSFKVNSPESPSAKGLNKLKVFFSKRKFVYEFYVDSNDLFPTFSMAAIDVPFSIVTAIHCNKDEVLISVCTAPKLFLGSKQTRPGSGNCTVFDRSRPTDITSGQLRECQIHKISMRRRLAEGLRCQLESFDPRFKILLSTPIFEAIGEISGPPGTARLKNSADPCKRIAEECGVEVSPSKKHCIFEVIVPKPSVTIESPAHVLCHCQVSCRSNRCSCMKLKFKCGMGPAGCMCKDCDNPLNILAEFGLNLDAVTQDLCLIQSIVSYKSDLQALLERKLIFKCCGNMVAVKECIPGKVVCSSETCVYKGTYKFSWCQLELCDEDQNPRNHCSACKTCKDPIELHCQACRKCNPVEGNCTKCTFCGAQRDTSFTEQPSIDRVLGRYRETQKRTFGSSRVESDLASSKLDKEDIDRKCQQDKKCEHVSETLVDSNNNNNNNNINNDEDDNNDDDDDGDLMIIEVTSNETSTRRCSSSTPQGAAGLQ